MYLERYIMENELKRIADAMEEIIRMVKKDQQETRERFEKRWDKEDE
jgi:proteasome assembly chaperone (PAC2) family protein